MKLDYEYAPFQLCCLTELLMPIAQLQCSAEMARHTRYSMD